MSDNAVELRGCRRRLGSAGDETVEFRLDEFVVPPRERVALTGPSGCGKSTLLNIVAGLVRADAGKVSVLGTDIGTLSAFELDHFRGRRMGFIYQSYNLLEPFTARENVLIGMRFGRGISAGERDARANHLLQRVGLSKRLDARPSRMSVGERQRVAIARALANKPALLLADEPTGALDPATADSVFALLMELCEEEGTTLLLVTHDLELAARLPRRFDCRGLVTHRAASEVA